MDNQKFAVKKFSGLSQDDGKSFISDFEAYCSLTKLSNDKLKLAAFQLHLCGPAKIWYDNLIVHDWNTLRDLFTGKYVEISQSDIIYQAERFQNFRLMPNSSLDEYVANIQQCGVKLGKTDTDMMLTFINGLPQRLAFFTRAGSPQTLDRAVEAAKLGEAYGYRDSDSHTVAAARPATNAELERKVDDLSQKLDRLLSMSNIEKPRPDIQICHTCNGEGHFKHQCNLARGKPIQDANCQLCKQNGHEARQCRTRFPAQDQGNFGWPRGDNRGPSRGPNNNRGRGRMIPQ